MKHLNASKVVLLLVEEANDLLLALLNARLDLRLEMILGQRSTDIRVVFEAEECVRVHRHKTLEKLLVTIEELIINLNIVAFLDLVQFLNLVIRREEVLCRQLVVFFLLIVSGVHDCKANNRVHLFGEIIELGPVVKIILQ